MFFSGWCPRASFHRYGFSSRITHLIKRQQHNGNVRMKCPYQVLGVIRTATHEEIRKAYLAKAKQYHPDANQDDETAHKRFLEIGEAYNTLYERTKDPQEETQNSRPNAFTYNRGRYYDRDYHQQNYQRQHQQFNRAAQARNNPMSDYHHLVSSRPGMSIGGAIVWIITFKFFFWFFWFDPLALFVDEDEWRPRYDEEEAFTMSTRQRVEFQNRRREGSDGPRWHGEAVTSSGRFVKKKKEVDEND